MLSGVPSLILLALIRVKHQVVGWASNVFAHACTALLCRFVLTLFMCLCCTNNPPPKDDIASMSGVCLV